jgi:hypothetical protein
MRTVACGVVRLCRVSRGASPIKVTNAFLPLLLVAAVAIDLSRVLVLKQQLPKPCIGSWAAACT